VHNLTITHIARSRALSRARARVYGGSRHDVWAGGCARGTKHIGEGHHWLPPTCPSDQRAPINDPSTTPCPLSRITRVLPRFILPFNLFLGNGGAERGQKQKILTGIKPHRDSPKLRICNCGWHDGLLRGFSADSSASRTQCVIFVDTQVCTGSESPSETRHRYEDPRECNPFRQITFHRMRSTASFATCNRALASVLLAPMRQN